MKMSFIGDYITTKCLINNQF